MTDPTPPTTKRRAPSWLLPSLVFALAAAIRLSLANHSLWFDEQASLFFSDQPFSRLWSDWMLRETNPPLYYTLLRMWRVFGSSDLAIRSLSIAASLCALALIFAIARRTYGNGAGFVALVLGAMSSSQIYYAEQARAYIFVQCATLVAAGALLLFSTSASLAHRRWSVVAFALSSTAAIYLHTTMLVFPAVAVAALLLANWKRSIEQPSWLLPIAAAALAAYLAGGWAIRIALLQFTTRYDNIAAVGILEPRLMAYWSLKSLFFTSIIGPAFTILSATMLVLVVMFVVADRASPATRLLAGLTVIGLAVFALIGAKAPFFALRTIFWMTGPTLILTSGAIIRFSTPLVRVAIMTALSAGIAVDTISVARQLEEEDWNTPVAAASRLPGSVMLVEGESMALLADRNCRRLRAAPCPYQVVALIDPDDHSDSWGTGSFAGPKTSLDRVAALVGDRPLFLFRKQSSHDVPDLLHRHGMGHGVPADGPPLIGPFYASDLR